MVSTPSPIERFNCTLFDDKELDVRIKRDDLIHPDIMGNKWRKLKYNLQYAYDNGIPGILTFGGAYSNHIAATAAACREFGFRSIGVIRGDELNANSNSTLRFASKCGMRLFFVTRKEFREIKLMPKEFVGRFPDYLCLPEGGTNDLAIKGCEEIIEELDRPFDFITTPLGTGGTMAGMLKGLKGNHYLLGFPALKGEFVHNEFARLCTDHLISFQNYKIFTDFHFGGYGMVTEDLVRFINQIKTDTSLQLDPIYTGKMVYGLHQLVRNDYFPKGSSILVLHTGGLQGIEGFNEKHPEMILR